MNPPSPGILNGVFALIGVFIGCGGTFFISYLGRKAEDRRHLREIGVKIGLANFEHAMVQAQKLADITQQREYVAPLYTFILEGITLVEITTNPKLTLDDIGVEFAAHRERLKGLVSTIQPK